MNAERSASSIEDLKKYKYIIIVAGSRKFTDYQIFTYHLELFLQHLSVEEDVLNNCIFVTGRAFSGPDDMIITWCKEHQKPWIEFIANWDAEGKGAGFIRNAKMADIGTHLLSYWDGESRGTKHMIDIAKKRSLRSRVIRVRSEKT